MHAVSMNDNPESAPRVSSKSDLPNPCVKAIELSAASAHCPPIVPRNGATRIVAFAAMCGDLLAVEMLLPFRHRARPRCWLRRGYDTLTCTGRGRGVREAR